MNSLFEKYLEILGESEAPITFHRWSFLTILGAWLGRRFYLPFGHKNINCNMYVMLMGEAGSRKTTAIEIAVKLLKTCGYTNIAPTKTSKERFFMDLAGLKDEDTQGKSEDSQAILHQNIFGLSEEEPKEILVAAEEFNVFVGNGNIPFLSELGALWDFSGEYKHPKIHGRSVVMTDPTVSIIAGNTATGFALAFPVESIGQGFFSRLLLIHGESTNKRITIPSPIDFKAAPEILAKFSDIRSYVSGEANLTPAAFEIIDYIYKESIPISDPRFQSYSNRRLTHLLKLCMLTAASNIRTDIEPEDVIYANTILTYAETFMPKALGEFGKAKNSDVAHKVVGLLEAANPPMMHFKDIWKAVCTDLEKTDDLRNIIHNLLFAEKIVELKEGGLAARSKALSLDAKYVDYNLLTEEERRYIL